MLIAMRLLQVQGVEERKSLDRAGTFDNREVTHLT